MCAVSPLMSFPLAAPITHLLVQYLYDRFDGYTCSAALSTALRALSPPTTGELRAYKNAAHCQFVRGFFASSFSLFIVYWITRRRFCRVSRRVNIKNIAMYPPAVGSSSFLSIEHCLSLTYYWFDPSHTLALCGRPRSARFSIFEMLWNTAL